MAVFDPLKFKNVSDENVNKLIKQKERFAKAPNFQEQQFASMEADKIRSQSGLESPPGGLASLDQLNQLMATRKQNEPKPVQPSPQDLQSQMIDRQKNLEVQNFQNALQQQMQGFQQERQQLKPLFREATGQVRTEDTMARERAGKMQETQGLSGAGAASQTDIAQNVIVGGQMSNLRQQRNEIEANINARMQQAQAEAAQGIATAENQAELQKMQMQLQQMETQAAAELKATELADKRAYDQFIRDVEFENETTLRLLDNELKQDNARLDGEIKLALDNNDFEQAKILNAQKFDNDQKLQVIKQSGAMQQIGARNQASQQQILLRDQLEREREQAITEEGGMPIETITQSLENVVGGIVNPEVAELQREVLGATDKTELDIITKKIKALEGVSPDTTVKNNTVMETLFNNTSWFEGPDGEMKLATALALNGLDADDLKRYKEFRESALSDRAFE